MKKIPGAVIIEGHVQGLSNTRALGETGIPVIVIDKNNCIARFSKYCKKFYFCPDYNSEEFIPFLISLAEKEKLNGWMLFPSNDHAVNNLSKHIKEISNYYKTVIPEIEIVTNIYNKELLLKNAQKCSVSYPESWFPETYEHIDDKSYTYPCIIKGKFGLTFYKKTGKKAFLANSPEELKTIIDSLKEKILAKDLFIQKLINLENNKTISYTAFCISGEIKSQWIGVKLREHPVSFGTATYARSIKNNKIYISAEKLLRELNYTGVCEVEFLFDPNDEQYKLIEINARTWLWVELAKNCGINYAILAYRFVNGLNNNYTLNYTVDKEWMHYITDIPFSIFGLLKGNYKCNYLIKSYFHFPTPAVFKIKDILPFLAEFFIVPLRFLKR